MNQQTFVFKGAMLEERDKPRINTIARRVWDYMEDGHWCELNAVAEIVSSPHSSVTACVRAFRYDENGAHTVETKRAEEGSGTWLYKLVPNTREESRKAKAKAELQKREKKAKKLSNGWRPIETAPYGS